MANLLLNEKNGLQEITNYFKTIYTYIADIRIYISTVAKHLGGPTTTFHVQNTVINKWQMEIRSYNRPYYIVSLSSRLAYSWCMEFVTEYRLRNGK